MELIILDYLPDFAGYNPDDNMAQYITSLDQLQNPRIHKTTYTSLMEVILKKITTKLQNEKVAKDIIKNIGKFNDCPFTLVTNIGENGKNIGYQLLFCFNLKMVGESGNCEFEYPFVLMDFRVEL